VFSVVGEPTELNAFVETLVQCSSHLRQVYEIGAPASIDPSIVGGEPTTDNVSSVAANVNLSFITTPQPTTTVDDARNQQILDVLRKHQVLSAEDDLSALEKLHPCFVSHVTKCTNLNTLDALLSSRVSPAAATTGKRIKQDDMSVATFVKQMKPDMLYTFYGGQVQSFKAESCDSERDEIKLPRVQPATSEQRMNGLKRVMTALISAAERAQSASQLQASQQSEFEASQRSRFSHMSHEEQADVMVRRFASNIARVRSTASQQQQQQQQQQPAERLNARKRKAESDESVSTTDTE